MRTVFFCLLMLITGVTQAQSPTPAQQIGQKLILDFRYFCAQGTSSAACRTPVTTLPDQLKTLLQDYQIGGVILFGQNIESREQVLSLNYAMQQAMAGNGRPPLFIAIDQEGGRVARLPDSITSRFVGNMAIGASAPARQAYFARQVAGRTASALKLLGFNTNFAPSVDINSNPANPVINVRSYGESPALVAELGQLTVAQMQQHGILSAVKHFPGHGDTHVDSHSGLPVVTHAQERIEQVELLPFKQILASETPPAMVMTAHIQYPALDDSTLTSRDGEQIIIPATLSQPILTGVLREQLGYTGLVVTDAMDMAGIAQFFTPEQALTQTFSAGADLALMPMPVRTPADIEALTAVIKRLAAKLDSGELDPAATQASLARIARTKAQFKIGQWVNETLSTRLSQAAVLPRPADAKIEQALARAALTAVKTTPDTLPLNTAGRWQVLMPDTARCDAFVQAVLQRQPKLPIQCHALTSLPATALPALDAQDVVIIGDISPQHSVAEMGGLDSNEEVSGRLSVSESQAYARRLLQHARQQGATGVFVAMRAPYAAADFAPLSTLSLATFGYNVTVNERGQAGGAVYEALADALLGRRALTGAAPVSLAR